MVTDTFNFINSLDCQGGLRVIMDTTIAKYPNP